MGNILFDFTLILSIAYALFLCWCILGWMGLEKEESAPSGNASRTFVSVIIPARNEEDNIHACLSDFIIQDYPTGSYELIVADDHSTDYTSEIVKKFIYENPSVNIQVIRMGDNEESKLYKKQAITEAISISTGELIITTDADCRRGPHWLSTMAHYYQKFSPVMMSAPVIFSEENNWFEKIQSLEFLGLIAIGAAAIKHNRPFLCNGANLAFTKEGFIKAGGYSSMKNIASGDDTQLMLKIAHPGKPVGKDSGRTKKIQFVKSIEATVKTQAQHSLPALLHQRKRWASKIPVQMNTFTIFIAIIAYFLHAGLFLSGLLMFHNGNIQGFLFPLLIKMIPEFILLLSISVFFKKSKLLLLFLPAQIIYPLYISVLGIASLSGNYHWKGRNI